MSHRYFQHSEEDIRAMLDRCRLADLDALYADVPEELRLKQPYKLPSEQSEKEVRDYFANLGSKNTRLTCFAGGGFYDHYAPAVIPALLSRSEFSTAYTPYQPEISQGTLQYIFEYQTMMTRLTGMEVSNASMYDGATATAEAMMMAVAHARKRNRVLISETVDPGVREVVRTYAHWHGITLDTIPAADGITSRSELDRMLAEGDVAGVIVAIPNYYGIIEDYTGWADAIHAAKALMIVNGIAGDLATLKTPGEWGADIAVGDAQSLGIPLSFGGPYLGYMCTRKSLMRKMPGRIVGATTDAAGQRVFVLTLQAREQHIRREKATSNICSNQGLMALYVTIYMSLMGADGLRKVNEQGCRGARYLAGKLEATGKMRLAYPDKPYLNEFVMRTTAPAADIIAACVGQGILPGVIVSEHELLIAVTEMQTREDMDRLAEIINNIK